jgi:hypothetical protein
LGDYLRTLKNREVTQFLVCFSGYNYALCNLLATIYILRAVVLKNTEVAKFWATVKLCINFDEKMGWATSWAIFSQTQLVALFSFATFFQ